MNATQTETVTPSRLIAELFRVHLQRHDIPCDIEALCKISSGVRPLVEFSEVWPRTTPEGARVAGELIAVFEEQT